MASWRKLILTECSHDASVELKSIAGCPAERPAFLARMGEVAGRLHETIASPRSASIALRSRRAEANGNAPNEIGRAHV